MVKAGERLGNYEILGTADGSPVTLGSGAGGVTFRGRHVHLSTEVAVKILLRRKNLLREDREAFLAEARAAAALRQPHIAAVLDFGESAEGHPYYVMELCEGGSLEDYAARAGSPDDYALVQWFLEAASALAYAHRSSLLHRDIKPSNLLLARQDGSAFLKLIDFGLAGVANEDDSNSQVIGTPDFAAPEQLQGRAQPASDVFSLGATFLRLITGKNLSQGDAHAVIHERLEATSYGHLLTVLPPAWRHLLGRMLEIDPAARPADGNELFEIARQTFPLHPGHPVMWNEHASIAGGDSPALQSQWRDAGDVPWSAIWQDAEEPVRVHGGVNVRARRLESGVVHEIFRFENLAEQAADSLVRQGDAIARQAAPLGLGEVILEKGNGWHIAGWPALSETNALAWTRGGNNASIAEVLAAIDPIATALDALKTSGLEGVEVHPSIIAVHPGPPLSFALPVQLPVPEAGQEEVNAGGTMRGASGTGMAAKLASSIYQLLSGRTPAPAAFVNARAYQAIPKLSEQANRFLASAIAGSLGGNCRDVVRGLAQEERLPGAAGLSGGGSMRASMSRLPGASVAMGGYPASASHSSPPAIPVATPSPAFTPISTPPPLSSGGTIMPPPPPPLIVEESPAASPTPVVAEKLAPVSTPPAKNKLVPVIASLAVVGFILAALAGGGWLVYKKFVAKKTAVLTSPENKVEAPPPMPPTQPEKEKNAENKGPTALIRVPTDEATLAAAIQRCKDGGTVEIDGGSFREPLVLSKSITLVSKNPALIEDASGGSSIVAVRGPVAVTLRNIVLKDSRRDAAGDAESAPPLLLATTGAKVVLDGCVFEGSMGSGVSVIDQASAEFTNCRIRKNRGFGIRTSAGGRIALSLCEIRENGLSGVLLDGSGTTATFGGGTTVTNNARNGVEAANGAGISCTGVEFNANAQAGIVAQGAGTTVDFGGNSVLSGNKKYGAKVMEGSRLVMKQAKVEENGSDNGGGILVSSSGKVELADSSFRVNGKVGLFMENGSSSSVKISRSKFEGHSDAGVAFVEGSGEVIDSEFSGNSESICFYENASGSAKGNRLDKEPVLDGAGSVSQENNTVSP